MIEASEEAKKRGSEEAKKGKTDAAFPLPRSLGRESRPLLA